MAINHNQPQGSLWRRLLGGQATNQVIKPPPAKAPPSPVKSLTIRQSQLPSPAQREIPRARVIIDHTIPQEVRALRTAMLIASMKGLPQVGLGQTDQGRFMAKMGDQFFWIDFPTSGAVSGYGTSTAPASATEAEQILFEYLPVRKVA